MTVVLVCGVKNMSLWKAVFPHLWLQVIPLDITVELQKQIMSELEILYKVGFDWLDFLCSVFIVLCCLLDCCPTRSKFSGNKCIKLIQVTGNEELRIMTGKCEISCILFHNDVFNVFCLINPAHPFPLHWRPFAPTPL